jgi:hypothetical protein
MSRLSNSVDENQIRLHYRGDMHPDVGPVYIKTKRLLLRRDTLTRDQGN